MHAISDPKRAVCVLGIGVICAKTAELTEVPFGVDRVSQKNLVLDKDLNPHEKGQTYTGQL